MPPNQQLSVSTSSVMPRAPAWSAEAAKMKGSEARGGSVDRQVVEMAQRTVRPLL
jgi:hypothetical protein